MPSSSASCWPRSVETARFSSQSHLLPIRIFLTPSVACCSTFENHVRISVKLFVCQSRHLCEISILPEEDVETQVPKREG